MFVQFIEGAVTDPEAFRRQMGRWQEECAPGAVGYLGSTAGVAADGTGFLAARFESAEAARANSDRPEQGSWWAETESCFEGPVAFTDCDDVTLMRGGGSDEAGFVQVISGRVDDVETARAAFTADLPDDERPDVLGGFVGVQPDSTYTTVVYFSSEAEARAGETAEGDDGGRGEQMASLHTEPPRFLDLTDPWLHSA